MSDFCFPLFVLTFAIKHSHLYSLVLFTFAIKHSLLTFSVFYTADARHFRRRARARGNAGWQGGQGVHLHHEQLQP